MNTVLGDFSNSHLWQQQMGFGLCNNAVEHSPLPLWAGHEYPYIRFGLCSVLVQVHDRYLYSNINNINKNNNNINIIILVILLDNISSYIII